MTGRLPRIGDQTGSALIELMVGSMLMVIIMLATLGTFDIFSRNTLEHQRVTSAEDKARQRIDLLAQTLRNAAGSGASATVIAAGPNDLAVNTDRPGFGITPGTTGTARYCVDAAATPTLWFNWTPAPNSVPSGACPSAGWTQREVVSNVANVAQNQPLFSYSSATPASVRSARLNLYLDTGEQAQVIHLQSGLFFRSLAETAPAVSGADVTSSCKDNVVSLNVAASTDVNGNPLTVTVSENGLQLATGSGSRTLALPSGVHDLVVRITNALGLTQTINQSVTCA